MHLREAYGRGLLASLLIAATLCAFVTADAGRRFSVRLRESGTVRTLDTQAATVAELLREAEIRMEKLDRVQPPPATPLADGMEVVVTRVRQQVVTEEQRIPAPVKRFADPALRPGVRRVVEEGQDGMKRIQWLITSVDGQEVSRKVLASKVISQPKPRIERYGAGGSLPARGFFSGRRVLTMIATGYAPYACGGSRTGRTATGIKAGYGTVAVDPRYIPLGTRLYIEGYGYAIAADTGGDIKGNRIDLGHDTYHQAKRVGMRKVKVYILD